MHKYCNATTDKEPFPVFRELSSLLISYCSDLTQLGDGETQSRPHINRDLRKLQLLDPISIHQLSPWGSAGPGQLFATLQNVLLYNRAGPQELLVFREAKGVFQMLR